MHQSARRMLFLACALALLPSAGSAKPQCKQMSYSVNDYGKEGPSRDAQALLDKSIEKWTQDNGVKQYTTGKKTVTCELFLDVIIFDEHTCKAVADVCWTPGKTQAKRVVAR